MIDKNEGIRNTLKFVGGCLMVVGVLLIIIGIGQMKDAEQNRDQQSREFMEGKRDIHDIDNGPPLGFFLIGGGMFCLVGGFGCLGTVFQRHILRYHAREVTPVVREALAEVAPGLAGGVKCPKCAVANAADSKFCKACGTGIASKACSRCTTANAADAKFCTSCGERF